VAIPKDGDGLADVEDLIQVMRDEENADAFRLQGADLLEQPIDFAAIQFGGGLIQYQEAGSLDEGPGNLEELSLADLERPGGRIDVEFQAPLSKDFMRLAAHARPGDELTPSHIFAQKQVLGAGQGGNDLGVLVDAGDAALPPIALAEIRRGGSLEEDVAPVRHDEASQERDESGFARAVAADERANLA
jgi:hypothetical protein